MVMYGLLAAQFRCPIRHSESLIPAERLTLCLPGFGGLDSVREGSFVRRFGACRVVSESIGATINLAG